MRKKDVNLYWNHKFCDFFKKVSRIKLVKSDKASQIENYLIKVLSLRVFGILNFASGRPKWNSPGKSDRKIPYWFIGTIERQKTGNEDHSTIIFLLERPLGLVDTEKGIWRNRWWFLRIWFDFCHNIWRQCNLNKCDIKDIKHENMQK